MIDDDDVSAARALIEALSRRPSADLVGRLRSLADDLARIREGTGPTAEELAAAPRLEDWAIAIGGGDPVLIGKVVGHPTLGERTIVTSGVWALDPLGPAWARTLSRWYALGAPAKAAPQPPKARSTLH
jgi:hypothetical protein